MDKKKIIYLSAGVGAAVAIATIVTMAVMRCKGEKCIEKAVEDYLENEGSSDDHTCCCSTAK